MFDTRFASRGVNLSGLVREDLGEYTRNFLGLSQRALHSVHVEFDPISLRTGGGGGFGIARPASASPGGRDGDGVFRGAPSIPGLKRMDVSVCLLRVESSRP